MKPSPAHSDVDSLRKALDSHFCLSGREREQLAAIEERLKIAEAIHDHSTYGLGHGFLIDRLCALENQDTDTDIREDAGIDTRPSWERVRNGPEPIPQATIAANYMAQYGRDSVEPASAPTYDVDT